MECLELLSSKLEHLENFLYFLKEFKGTYYALLTSIPEKTEAWAQGQTEEIYIRSVWDQAARSRG